MELLVELAAEVITHPKVRRMLTYYYLPGFPPLHTPLAEYFYRKQMAEIVAKLWT